MYYLTSEEGRSYAILILSYLQTLQAQTTLIKINGHVRDLKLEVPTQYIFCKMLVFGRVCIYDI